MLTKLTRRFKLLFVGAGAVEAYCLTGIIAWTAFHFDPTSKLIEVAQALFAHFHP